MANSFPAPGYEFGWGQDDPFDVAQDEASFAYGEPVEKEVRNEEGMVVSIARTPAFKAVDALRLTADGKVKKLDEKDAVAGTASILDLIKKDISSGLISREFYKQYLGEPRREEGTPIDQMLRGWRPVCECCRRGVDQMTSYRDEMNRRYIIRLFCHGSRLDIPLNETECVRMGSRELMKFIERCQPFWNEAQRREVEQGGMSPNYIKQKAKYLFADEIDDQFKFDDSEMLAIQQEMAAEQMRRVMSMAASGASTAVRLSDPGSASSLFVTSSGSSAPPARKPTKAELLAMLAEIEKSEPKPAVLPLNQERVITL